MKVIGIAGSLRARSNTLHYVKTSLTVLKEEGFQTELISLRDQSKIYLYTYASEIVINLLIPFPM